MKYHPPVPSRNFFRIWIVAAAVLGLFATSSSVGSQEPKLKENTGHDSRIVLRQTVRRVRVDVVVTDAQGHPVTGLLASDFRVAEDGRLQAIRHFEYHNDEIAETALPTRPTLPPHTFMNLPAVPEHGPLTVLVYDILNTPLSYQLAARAQMVEFLRKIPGRRIAIFVLGDQLRFVQGFTSDADLIERAIGDPALRPHQPETSVPQYGSAMLTEMAQKDHDFLEFAAQIQTSEAAFAAVQMELRVDLTTDAFKQIAHFLSAIPGRKNLIWYTGSFPIDNQTDRGLLNAHRDRIRDSLNQLNSAEVSVYSIDARGLVDARDFEDTETLSEVSEQTGGRAFYNTNALEDALITSSIEGSSYYSLVYAPTNAKYDGSVRRISVHLAHDKYRLAYRRSYIADDVVSNMGRRVGAGEDHGAQEKAFASAHTEAADDQFGAPPTHRIIFAAHVDAVGQPAPATTEQMAALEPYRMQMAKVEHKKYVAQTAPVPMQQYAIAYGVLAKQLEIPKSTNGRFHSDLSFAVLAFSRDGEILCGTETRLKDDIPAAMIDKVREDGFQATQRFSIPVETAVIRLMVSDEQSGKTGSMEIRLPLPSK